MNTAAPMAEDYYKTLGLSRNASADDIQKAYRDLARKYHPDLNPDDKTAKKKFQEVQQAFEVLNDASKRELYDRYGSSFEQMHGGGPQGGAGRGGSGVPPEDFDFSQIFGQQFGGRSGAGGAGQEGFGGFGDIFRQFTRAGGRQGGRSPRAERARGENLNYELHVPFQTAILGGSAQLAVRRANGRTETINVKIPAGIDDGKTIRLRGQGEAADGGRGTPGDILLAIRVDPHPYFHRRGKDLLVRLPVTVGEAALGAKVDVPTPHGAVVVRIPPGTSSGAKLRIRGHGIPDKAGALGDLFAEVHVTLPKQIDPAAAELLRQFDQQAPTAPRGELRW